MLKRKTALIVLSIVLAFALVAAASLAVVLSPDKDNFFADVTPDTSASAAITPATSFGTLPVGSKYYYSSTTAGAADIAVSVTGGTHGLAANPFVIASKEQWALFVKVTTEQNNSAYTGSNKVWVLNADINLGANTINEAARHTNGFQGTLYGNKHSISNGTIQWSIWVPDNTSYSCSLFHFINGGKVYDLNIESSIKLTMKTDINATKIVHMAGLASVVSNTTIVGVNSNVGISVSQTGTTSSTYCAIGGLVGVSFKGSNYFYKVNYNGNIYYRSNGTTAFIGTDDQHHIGGIIGRVDCNTTLDQFSTTGTLEAVYCGNDISFVIGKLNNAGTITLKVSNGVLNGAIKATKPDPHPAYGVVVGWDHNANPWNTASSISNIYIGNCSTTWTKTDGTTYTGLNMGWTFDLSRYSNVYIAAGSATVRAGGAATTASGDSGGIVKSGSVAAVVNAANANASINKNYTVSTAGGISQKNASTYHISVNKGAGVSNGANDTTYNAGATSVTLSAPTRTGYTFKGWSLTGLTGAVSGSTSALSLPSGTKGNINIYAVWETNDFGGTAPKDVTVTYGEDATLSAAGLTHTAGTTSDTTGVTITYKWVLASAPGTSLGTASTYKVTNPAYTAGTNYQVTATATPKDGITPARVHTYTVSLKVKRQGVPLPVQTDRIYTGSEQVGITASSNLVTLTGPTKGTNAGTYHVDATLPNNNYCWGTSGSGPSGTDVLGTKGYDWVIEKATVAVPEITAGASQVYANATLKPTVSESSFYIVTNNGGKDVGDYNVTVNLKDTDNYKWATAPSTGESGEYTLPWEIIKADLDLEAPTFVSNSVTGGTTVYVGQHISDLTITQTSGKHVRAGSGNDNVEGTYAWKDAASTRIANGMTGLVVTFTPSAAYAGNYKAGEVTVPIAPIQLKLNVQEVRLEYLNASGSKVDLDALTATTGWATNDAIMAQLRSITQLRRTTTGVSVVSINMDYNKTFDLSVINKNGKITIDGVEFNLQWQMPAGYHVEFFDSIDSSSKEGIGGGYGSNHYTNPVTADKTVYLGYVADMVDYTIVTVKESLGGANQTATNNEILQVIDGTASSNVTSLVNSTATIEQTGRALAGSRVSYSTRSDTAGFTRQNSLATAGDRTFTSTDTSRFVLGIGKTVIITYYARNTYTINWTFSGGSITVEGITNPISNRYTQRLKYGEAFSVINNVEYSGGQYTFDTWYTDSACTQVFDVPATMPSTNLNLYAGRNAHEFTITYDYNWGGTGNTQGVGGTVFDISAYADYQDLDPIEDRYYTIDQILSNGVIRFPTPAVSGLKFVRWVYFNDPLDPTVAPDYDNPKNITNISRTNTGDYQLYAIWAPADYRITLDVNGGDRFSPSYINQTNLSHWNDNVSSFNGEDYLNPNTGKYEEGTVIPDGFYMPTRAGYTFLYWGYLDKFADASAPDNEKYVPVRPTQEYDYLVNGTTLYAVWRANPVKIEYATNSEGEIIANTDLFELAITSSAVPGITFSPDETANNEYLYRGSTITITVTPISGYEVSSITLAGSTYNNGGIYTVRTYTNDTIILDVQLTPKRYNITYVWDGGRFVASSDVTTYPRTFTLEEEINIIDEDNVVKEGYIFAGWHLGSLTGDIISNEKHSDGSESFYASEFGAYNVVLYAEWQPAPVTMVYHNGDGKTHIVDSSDANPQSTGGRITLFNPDPSDDGDSFIPSNMELVGWSETPAGAVKYNVDYAYNPDNADNPFTAQPVSYTIKVPAHETNIGGTGKEGYVNNLYARWRVANAENVMFEATNNNLDFAVGRGVTLTARPRRSYTQDANLKLVFEFYKVDEATWATWTQEDIDKIADATEKAQAQTYLGVHKIPANAQPIDASTVLQGSGVGPADQKAERTFYNVKDSGTYLVKLVATRTHTDESGTSVTTVTMYGEYSVIINKANLETINWVSADKVSPYNGQPQGLDINVSAAYALQSNGTYKLPDGSFLKVTYHYTDVDTIGDNGVGTAVEGRVTNVGLYIADATFSIVDASGNALTDSTHDDANYVVPAALNGSFEITPLTINTVNYSIETKIGGVWTALTTGFAQVYTGQQFRIVATPVGLVAGDEALLTIVMYYDGIDGEDHSIAPINVGHYVAYCDEFAVAEGVTDDRTENYVLSNLLPTQSFEITKATHDVTIAFNNSTVTYDEALHELAINSVADNKANANATVTKSDDECDTFTLSDGSTITAYYSVISSYLHSGFTPDASETTSFRGGIHAGTYYVTINFEDTNSDNYNTIEPIEAKLEITRAQYKGDGKNVGLSENQLQSYYKNANGQYTDADGKILSTSDPVRKPDGFGSNVSVSFDGAKGYVPSLKLDENYFDVVYSYEQIGEGDIATPLTSIPTYDNGTKTGFHDAGKYRITATVSYVDAQYINDYVEVADQIYDLIIEPGDLVDILIDFDQSLLETVVKGFNSQFDGYRYGSGFDFYEHAAIGDEYRYIVKVMAVYQSGSVRSSETVDNNNVQFYNEDGINAFTTFDRATIKGEDLATATAISGDGYYNIKVGVRGHAITGENAIVADLKVKVRQAALTNDSLGFDLSDNNMSKNGNDWSYKFTYDGDAHYPAVDSVTNTAFNYVGIDGAKLKPGIAGTDSATGADVIATYAYIVGTNYASAAPTDWKPMPAGGLENKGVYTVRVVFTTNNSNYKDLTNQVLYSRFEVESRVLTASDIEWQYSTTDDGTPSALQRGKNLAYAGASGYYIRARFANLAYDSTAPVTGKNQRYFNISEIALVTDNVVGTAGANVQVVDAGSYTVRIITLQSGLDNYVCPSDGLDATLVIDPAPVELNWELDGGVSDFTYTGTNQLGDVTATYVQTYDEGKEGTASVKVLSFNGNNVSADNEDYILNAGEYVLVATIGDEDPNYKPAVATYTLTVKPYVLTNKLEIIRQYEKDGSIVDVPNGATWTYVGEEIKFYAKFATIGDDLGDPELDNANTHYIRVALSDLDGNNPLNAGNYVLSAKYDAVNNPNYDLSNISFDLTVNKAKVEVTWLSDNSYEYDGNDHTIEAEALGLGREEKVSVVGLTDATQRDTNEKAGISIYFTTATIASQYADNYELTGEGVSGGVAEFTWSITPRKVGIEWNTDGLVYNNGKDIEWSYDLTNVVENENIYLTFDITYKAANGDVKALSLVNAGDYSIQVTGISDKNYSYEDITAPKTVTVSKATPVLSNIRYIEYTEEVGQSFTYQNNKKLRDDKIKFDSVYNGVEVEGTATFKDANPNLTSLTARNFAFEFTPANSNYNTVTASVSILIKADSVESLMFDNVSTLYAVGQKFRGASIITAYYKYKSYYEEDNGTNTPDRYGKYDEIDSSLLIFYLNNQEITSAYEFTSADAEANNGKQTIKIYAPKPGTPGKTIPGSIEITIISTVPTSLQIMNKEELEAGTYYVGSKFDISKVKFYAEYENTLSNGPVDYTNIDCANLVLEAVGTQTLVFTYFTGTENEQTASLQVTVSPKIVVAIADPSRTYRYTGQAISVVPTQADGTALPEGISYRITDVDDAPISMVEVGVYNIKISFTVPETMYDPIKPVLATIEIKLVVAELVANTPNLERVYSGNSLTADDYALRGISVINPDDDTIKYTWGTPTYTVNGKSVEGFNMANAGTYRFTATVVAKEVDNEEAGDITLTKTYEIVIKPAENAVTTFTINNWVYGVGSGTITFDSTFGAEDRDIEFFRLKSETDEIGATVSYNTLPTEIGRYRAVVTVHDTPNYSEATSVVFFSITKPLLNINVDANGEPMKNEEGKDIVQVTNARANDGVNPFYNLRVELIKDTSDVTIKNQVVVVGYDVDIVNSSNEAVQNPGEYTVKLLLTEEQRDAKNYRNLKVYIVDEYGVAKEISNARVDDEGYMVFSTDNFNGNFIVSAQDAAAIAQMWWIIGLCIGGVIALIAIISLIVVVVKKKKEND